MKTEDAIKKLTQMEKSCAEKETQKSRIEGALDNAMQELKTKYKINTDDQLSKELDNLETSLDDLEKQFVNVVAELEDEYDWSE
jgi:hypothetical protein